jgi:group I intron endonuclease
MTCGIYGIFSEDSQRVYIGQAQDIEQRWSTHKSSLIRNNHHCKFLQNHYNKHRKLKLELLEICNAKDLSFNENKNWNWYKNLGYVMFNQEMSPDSGYRRGENHPAYGVKRSLEVRQKISQSKIGELNPMYGKKGELNPMYGSARFGGLNPRARFEYILMKNNVLIKTKTIAELERDFNLTQGKLNVCFNLKPEPNHSNKLYQRKSHKGFYPVARTNLKTQITELYDAYFSLTSEQLKELQND